MAQIVDFEQDPNAAYGTGNFRDVDGRVMYLHDPDTAQQFVKTMPGALPGKVASESNDIASSRMDGGASLPGKVGLESDMIARQAMGKAAPVAGPDQRLASNMTDAFEGVGGGTTATDAKIDAPPAPPVGSTLAGNPLSIPTTPPAPGQFADVQSVGPAVAPGQDASKAAVMGYLTGKLPGAPAAPAAAEAPPGATPGATPGPEAPPVGTATVSPRDAVASYLTGLGKAKNQTVTTTTTAYGRPDDNIAAEQRGADIAAGKLNTSIHNQAEGVDTRTRAGIAAEQQGLTEANSLDNERKRAALKEEREAKDNVARLNQAYQDNEKTLDPQRFVKNLSTGQRVGMVILAAINGAFGALADKKNNDVLDTLNAEIERDIDAQKNQIAGNRNLLGNQIAEFMRQGHDAGTAADLARDRIRNNVIALAKLEREQKQGDGQAQANADVLVNQLGEQREAQKAARLKEGDDRVTEAEQITKGTPQGGGLDEALKLIQLQNAITDQQDAAQVNAIIDPTGKVRLSPERVKEVKAAVRETGGAVGETSVAMQKTKTLVEDMGGKADIDAGVLLLPGDIDPRTGQVVPGTLKGVGPLASRPSLDAANSASHIPVIGGVAGPIVGGAHKLGRSLGLIRTDYDRNKDNQNSLKESITNMTTGANSNLRQDATFQTMSGNDFENEEQTRQNLHAWFNTLVAQRNGQLARLGPEGQTLYFHNLQAAQASQSAPGTLPTAPPLRPHVAGGAEAAPAPAAPAAGAGAAPPVPPVPAAPGGSTEPPKAPGPSTTTAFRPGTYRRLRESRPNERP